MPKTYIETKHYMKGFPGATAAGRRKKKKHLTFNGSIGQIIISKYIFF